jgi:hypothetical protein
MAFSKTFDPAPSATTVQGSSVSNREDLLDVLTILAPEETPILSSAQKQKANSTFVEWTVDNLAAPSTAGVAEGADVTQFTDKFASRARLGNFVQKFRRDYLVSDLQEAVDSVGPAKVAQAEAKAIRELKRDIEATLSSNNDRASEDGAGQAYKLRGLHSWIGGTQSDIPSDYQTGDDAVLTNTEAASDPLTETRFNKMITEIFKKTGNVNNLTLFAGTGLRRHISDFARFGSAGSEGTTNDGTRRVQLDNGEASIKLGVDLYQSDHGIVSIVNANPDCTTAAITGEDENNSGLLLNPEYYGVSELIPMGSTRLPNLGGGERGFVDCALTLLMMHPQAHGRIGDIT